ncbi:MAG: DinB family protein [Candidatus Sulfotelmatobacter sp.]
MASDLIRHFQRQFAYDAWANHEVLAAVRDCHSSAARSLQLFAHIVSAKLLWLERLQGQPQSQPVWPEWGVEQCEARSVEVGKFWRKYLETLAPGDLSKTASYKNSKGEPWASTVEDVVTHVLLHSAYHRGQIASFMRASGDTPAYTDFIHAVRQGLIGQDVSS